MIRRALKISLAMVLLAGCPKSGSDVPQIDSFTATPDTIHAGDTATLAWTVTGASQVTIDGAAQTGNTLDVTPADTTTYHLKATSPGGDATATVTVTVLGAIAKPVITSFTASPDDVPSGTSSTLAWTVTGTVTKLMLGDGVHPDIDVTGLSQKDVVPDAPTTYTLTATNGGGSASLSKLVNVHNPSLRLQYSDPSSSTAKILVVKNSASTNNNLILDVKTVSAAVTAFGIAMNIPLAITILGNPAVNGPFAPDTGATTSAPGIITTGGVINIGSSPATGAIMVGGAAMPKFISVGVAKHKATLADGDTTWPADTNLFSISLKMVGSPATGNVFIGSTVATDPGFRAAALRKDGSEAVGKSDFALGDFIISL